MPETGNTQNLTYNYQVGGSLQLNAPSYVERQADKDFYEGLKSGEFCYVLNSRQMGKSSLRVQTMHKLQKDGIACAVIDITAIGSQDITQSEWYLGVIRRLSRSFTPKVKLLTWWRDYEGLSPQERLSEFIESVLLEQITQKIVIFIDEIDSILKLNFKDNFLALLRACYNKRSDNPAYQRLTFALLGVTTPYDLVRDKDHTPFNIGRAIQLSGFQEHEAQSLAQGLVGKAMNPQAVLKEILAWTGGQPFLTQKLCKLIFTSDFFIPAGNETKCIETLVRSEVIENWESQDEPEHLKTIRDRILRSEQRSERLLKLYQQILRTNQIIADASPEQMELRLSGLVVKHKGCLKVYNRIYASVFNLSWVDKALLDLQPYRAALKAWVASNYQDDSYLLRGQVLQNAQVWAEGKSLSSLDQRFLAASFELETRELQFALLSKKKSGQILPSKPRLQTVFFLSVIVTFLVMGVRHLGMLQLWELQTFDRLMQLRANEKPDPRLLIVTITEDDFQLPEQQHRKGSLSDQSLALLVNKLKQFQARTIGLDIYRDFSVDPKQANLATWMRQNNGLIAICKASEPKLNEPGVAPPPEIPVARQGFSDFVQDPDGILRRHLIAMKPDPASSCTTPYAFSAQLAFDYLKSLDISAQYTPTKELQIGKVVFKRLRSHTGGYQQVDDRGYQILLNYRSYGSPLKVAEQVTLKDVLTNKIKPEMVKGRIVIIGIMAQSASDYFPTPYTTGQNFYQRVPGVVVHAQMVSQMLSTVLNGRPLLWVWSTWSEALWIWLWAILGGILAWRIHNLILLWLAEIATFGILFGLSLMFMVCGGWIPLIPSALTLVVAATSVTAYGVLQTNNRIQREQARENRQQ
ncbi:CHASE2 domain-containing protein [Nostoc commune]|uniref:CHASE2 domain-containing protein n=1 Tax=Nostoc commune TaxID=1178 RepID=UPI0018C7EE45|nr:CHASE2 domain-containing protein [Nostoc commune]MBG1261359.1 CHASE2 domain-containing protein [Nostoc commune BAE]